MKNRSPQQKINHTPIPKKNYNLLKWLLLFIFVLLVLFLITKPLRTSSATGYVERGDELLMQKKYLSADLEYEKALSLGDNHKALERRTLVKKCSRDITEMAGLLSEKNNSALLNLFAEANAVPSSDSFAVRKSKELIEKKEYQLAIIPTLTAIEMDQNYRDAWLYLGIANLKSAQYLEINSEDKAYYLESAKKALNQAKALDPEYAPTEEYLKQIAEAKLF